MINKRKLPERNSVWSASGSFLADCVGQLSPFFGSGACNRCVPALVTPAPGVRVPPRSRGAQTIAGTAHLATRWCSAMPATSVDEYDHPCRRLRDGRRLVRLQPGSASDCCARGQTDPRRRSEPCMTDGARRSTQPVGSSCPALSTPTIAGSGRPNAALLRLIPTLARTLPLC